MINTTFRCSIVRPSLHDNSKRQKKVKIKYKIELNQCFDFRILIATNAYELKIDNKNVKRVVQRLMSQSMTKLYQRLKRTMRSDKKQTHFVFLHFVWCADSIESFKQNLNIHDTTVNKNFEIEKKINNKKNANKRRKLSHDFWNLMNFL